MAEDHARSHRALILTVGLVLVAFALVFVSGAAAAKTSFNAHGSAEQVYATKLPPGAKVSLLDPAGQVVATKDVDFLGGILFRHIKPGDGYRVRLNNTGETSGPLKVLTTKPTPPSTAIYDQKIPSAGYGYLTTRDGTKLAYDVHPPTDVSQELGVDLPESVVSQITDKVPSPTLIEYSGYGYARPSGPVNGIAALANLMGFTVVDVNMRGTGCSGGAYDFFEPLQNLDGYDVIETIARQPWVAHHKVGMLGISYGGISQLFVAQEQPPHLAAISPQSVIDSTQTTLYPGGILNTGFAVKWAKERVQQAKPADPNADPNDTRYGGQPYADKRIANGDKTCAANQALHPEAVNLLKKVRANAHYVPKVADPLAPITFVNKINVPVFMACQWTDEQVGGHCPTLAEHMTGTDKKWFTFTNGVHTDSLDPATYNRLFDFLEIYVAHEAPITKSALVRASFPVVFQAVWGINGPDGLPPPEATLPPDPIQMEPTYDLAKAAFQALPQIRVLFDNGAGKTNHPGWPYPGFEQSFSSFPIPGTTARSWYLGPGGSLAEQPITAKDTADAFTWDAHATPLTDFTGNTGSGQGGLWTALPKYQWTHNPDHTAVSYITAPLDHNTTVIGAGRVDLWVQSSTPNVDLQATISEVRPDGKETFVQNGWVRANERKLDAAKSTLLEPVLSLRKSDVSPLPQHRFTEVTIPLYYEGHVYRAGSRIRVKISAPNGDQPIWSFSQTDPQGTAQVEIGYGRSRPSRLLLPVVPDVTVPTGLPPCPGLRGEPCRDYQPKPNEAAPPSASGGGGLQGSG